MFGAAPNSMHVFNKVDDDPLKVRPGLLLNDSVDAFKSWSKPVCTFPCSLSAHATLQLDSDMPGLPTV